MKHKTRRDFLGGGAAILFGAGAFTAPQLVGGDDTESITADDIEVRLGADSDVSVEIMEVNHSDLLNKLDCTVHVHANEGGEYNIRLVFLNEEGVSFEKDGEENQYLLRGETARFDFHTRVPAETEAVAIAVGQMGDSR